MVKNKVKKIILGFSLSLGIVAIATTTYFVLKSKYESSIVKDKKISSGKNSNSAPKTMSKEWKILDNLAKKEHWLEIKENKIFIDKKYIKLKNNDQIVEDLIKNKIKFKKDRENDKNNFALIILVNGQEKYKISFVPKYINFYIKNPKNSLEKFNNENLNIKVKEGRLDLDFKPKFNLTTKKIFLDDLINNYFSKKILSGKSMDDLVYDIHVSKSLWYDNLSLINVTYRVDTPKKTISVEDYQAIFYDDFYFEIKDKNITVIDNVFHISKQSEILKDFLGVNGGVIYKVNNSRTEIKVLVEEVYKYQILYKGKQLIMMVYK